MKKTSITLMSLFLVISALVHAGATPKYLFVATTPTHVEIQENAELVIQYKVTNNGKFFRTLVMKPIAGVIQITTNPGVCQNPMPLAPGQSCLLTLKVNGNQTPTSTITPTICRTKGPNDNNPSPFSCSQPRATELITVRKLPASPAFLYTASADLDAVITCKINTSTWLLENCFNNDIGFDRPTGLKLTANNSRIYVANDLLQAVKVCDLNPNTGEFLYCSTITDPLIAHVHGIVFNNQNNRVYLANFSLGASTVVTCNLNIDAKTFSNCKKSDEIFNGAVGIVLNAANTKAYVGNFYGNYLKICDIDEATGLLINCATKSLASSATFLYLSRDNSKIYIADNTTILLCPINQADGLVNSCQTVHQNAARSYNGLDLNFDESKVYLGNYNGTVEVCDVDKNTGFFNNCMDTGSGFNSLIQLLITT